MDQMVIPEFRRNSPFGHWRLFAKERSKKPHEPDLCPFCPGNEAETPHILFKIPEHGEWRVRVIPNKYPFLRIEGRPFKHDGEFDIQSSGPWQRLDGTGAHEVIIESRRHNAQFHEFSADEIMDVLQAACVRYHDLKKDRRFNYFFLFRNTGHFAGMSLEHPHCQIKASVVIPEGAAEILNEYRRYYEAFKEQCLYCDHLTKVLEKRGRINSLFVNENESCVAFVPYAPEFLNEVWIVPRTELCNSSFAYPMCDSEQLRRDIARMLRDITRRLSLLYVDQPLLLSYNIAFHTAPYFDDSKAGVFHWHIRILPRGFSMGGSVEIATKLRILPSLPESWAEAMRALELQE